MNQKSVKVREVKPPPWADKRTEVLSIRFTEVELECLREQARDKGLGISTLVRSILKEHARLGL